MALARSVRAPAKVNLTLTVHGRTPSGLHAIEGVVLFAGLSDRLYIKDINKGSARWVLTSGGRFHEALPEARENLIMKAARLFSSKGAGAARIHLEKSIPLGAGLGGGSADAAAFMRDAMDARGMPKPSERDLSLLGSDIPVCLFSAPALIHGHGEVVRPLLYAPDLFVLLVKPPISLATARVYEALSAPLIDAPPMPEVTEFRSRGDFLRWILARPNDLQGVAERLERDIKRALDALRAEGDPLLVRMSGSGSCCFAIYATAEETESAADSIARRNPTWWVCATSLKGTD